MEKKTRQLTPEQDALEHILAGRDKPFLEERFIDSFKGRGVFTRKAIEPSTFVVEYRGNIFSHKDTRPEKKCGDTLNNYLFKFSWEGAHWCIDASTEDRTLGRLVNDDHISPNCEMKKVVCEGKPHLCLFAVKKISPGEEITYSYGDSSYPWRSTEPFGGSSTSYTDFSATSTPGNERFSDSEAASSVENSGSDDDDELPDSGASNENDSFANIISQLDFRNNSPTDLDSSREMSGTSMLKPDHTSCTQQEDEGDFSSDEDDWDGDSGPSKAKQKPKNPTSTCINYCYVCRAGCSKIARHLFTHAYEEPDIAQAFALPKKSKERKKLLTELRNRGNYRHNQEVLKNNSGELKLRRRSTAVVIGTKTHVHCPYCKGMFKRKELWRHVARCPSKTISNTESKGKAKILTEIALAESPYSQKLPSVVWKVLSTMQQDETASAVQNDFLLIQLAQCLCEKYETNPNKHDYIRQKLREMGRLLIALHGKSIFSFEEAIKPKNFYKVVEAVRDIAGFDEKMQSYKKTTLALKLRHSLKKICTMVLTAVDGDEQVKKDTKTFMKLCAREWSELVSQTAIAPLSGRKVNNPSTIPFTRDMQVFYRYLETTSASAIESLKMHESPQAYNALSRVTLAQVSVLNKCIPEVSKMTLKTFQERGDTTRVLSKRFIRINILSRTGQKVAVLLTSELVSAITLLVSKREACGVHQDNPFLFARPNSSPTSLYNGRNCIRAFSSLCHAKNPEHLRSVHLHKHIARVFQILNLENDELRHLAKLLGHDIRTDRDYYRLPEAAVELAKIAKLLLAMEKGSLERFKGSSLQEIEIEDELEPDVEQGNPENGEAEEDDEESDLLLQQSGAVEQQAVMKKQRRQLTPEQDAREHIKSCRDKPFLEEAFIDSFKGRGVFTRESIEPSTFVVEFRGNIFPHRETRRKKCGDTLSNYLFNFSWSGRNWCVNASKEDGTLGRLVNDNHMSPNCKMRKIVHEGKPHLCLFAVKKISPGEEITFNYGDSSYPWRSTAEDSAGASSSAESCCDDDYVPDDEPSSDEGSTSSNNQQCQDFEDSPDPDSSEQQPVGSSPLEREDEADSSSDEKPKDPSYARRNYCYICGKAQSKISRHLFTHRKEEPEIAEVFALRRHSKERHSLLVMLRNRGNYKHNQQVLKTCHGELKVSRRDQSLSTNAKAFTLCLYCKGTYTRKDMWRHMQKCSLNKSSMRPTGGWNKVLALVVAAELTDSHLSSDVKNMFRKMKKDEIASVVWNDPHILRLAQCLCHMNEGKTKNHDYITHKLRLMGRLLLTLRKKSISSFEDAVKPQNFSKLVEAVRELTSFNQEAKSYDSPSLIMKLANLLKKVGDINFAMALKDDTDTRTTQEAVTFMKLCTEEWGCLLPPKYRVRGTRAVPFIHDVQLFYQCTEKTTASAVKSLTMYGIPQVYHALLRVVAAQVSVLNKNMAEVSKVTLKSFNERDETEPHEDAEAPQSQLDQILSKHSVKINVVSIRGKKLAVTLTPKLLSAITLLVSKRDSCGVNKNNPFLFARPVAACMSFCHGRQCLGIFTARCGAKSAVTLRSVHFRKYIARVFQILSLTKEELEQLAQVLGQDIRTDREYYQTPEAAVDIAKVSELMSAMQNGSAERFKGKSFEEIEISDELEPDMEDNPENSDAEEDNEESESSLQLSGLSSSKGSSSTAKNSRRVSSSRKRGRGRKRRKKSESEESELNDEKKDEDAEMGDGSEDVPESCDISTPEKTLSRSNEDATRMSFSDDDEDMNVDFDMDTDEDFVTNEDRDGDTNSSAAMSLIPDVHDKTEQDNGSSDTRRTDSPPNKPTAAADPEETVDKDGGNRVEEDTQKRGEEQKQRTDVDSRSSSAFLNTEKTNILPAVVAAMKEVKILIPKLDIEKLRTQDHMSQSHGQPVHDDSNQRPASTDSNEPSDAKHNETNQAAQMTCSHCKTTMMKGQTAYQKKGFTDVFCSKNCLFKIFPINRPVSKTCHHCLRPILQPLDLIMAAVDVKGTMKDFCSVTCLSSFKSNNVPTQTLQSTCSMCNKSCTTARELTLNKELRKFCSDSCLEDFRRDNTTVCENCGSAFHSKPLVLKLKEETKTICSGECLDEFKKKIKTPHQCNMCHVSKPMSDMVHFKTGEDMVELFCTRTCVTSYSLRPAIVHDLKGKKMSARLKKRKRGKQSKLKVNAKEASAAAESDAPSPVTADSNAVCHRCGKTLLRGQTLYQLKSSPDVFCSASCFSERHPHVTLVTKKCHNCLQVITRPQNIILAPVDDSGTMKELCSNTCLTSVTCKRNMAAPKPPPLVGPRSECRMCSKFCFCGFRMTLDGSVHRLCSNACLINFHKVNNLSVFTCDVCGSVCQDERLLLKMENGSKNICSEECLVKFKEKVATPQLCPMCQTTHQMSDMVENKNDEGKLDFFCSNRCMMVHKAQSFTVSGGNNSTFDENDTKEVKPSLPNLKCIKEEPIDEEYNQNLSSSIPTEDIKDEPNVVKDDLKIGSVFSLTGDSASAAPTLTHMDFLESCSNCKKVLMDGETVYQRKGHTYIFCATSCLLKFYQMKQAKKTCHFCLQTIEQSQDVIQAPVDNEETMKDFCSQTCLSSFNYKRIMSTKIAMVPVASHSQCSMCSRYCISKHEIIQQDVIHKICSDPCFLRFCTMNNLSICENCRSHCSSPVMLKMGDGSTKLCSAECLAQFKQKIRTPQPCSMCCTPCLMSDMVENKNSEDVVELFCTYSCVMASKIQTVSAAGTTLNCDNCGKSTVPACHLAMSDASIRNFCTLTCAMAFKESQNAATNTTAASEKTHWDFLKPPEKLPCAQCRRILKTTPQVVQKKGKMNFVCSLACSQEFKRVNNIMGKCEYCKNERIIRDAKRVNGKDCYFCSDGCKMLFCHELEKEWGEHCRSCAYCLSISKTVVTAQYKGTDETFCSEDCNSNYKMLFCHVARCDTCGREGKLRQSLHMLGEVKHFCDLKCLLHFCNKKVQMVNTVSSPGPASTAESSPVITNTISLAGALKREPRASASSAQHVSVPDIQTKVVGHASVQTVTKEVKNKSLLCTPLVHNKGVSCTTQTMDTEAQTDEFAPKVIVLPVPVPVYVPVPMNMYSQCTPKPVGLPLPLPVPVFLPVTPDPTVTSTKETIQPDPSEGELNSKPALRRAQDERNDTEDGQKDSAVTQEGQGIHIVQEHTSQRSHDSDLDHQAAFDNQEDSFSDSSFRSFTRPHTHEKPPQVLEVGAPSESEPPPPAPAAPPAPPAPEKQTGGKVHNKNKGWKLQQFSKAAKKDPSHRNFPSAVTRKHHRLKSQCGIDAWKRWIQWRRSQTSLHLISLNEDVLRSSATELSDGLCCFITEVKQADGEPYGPDGLFYLCLSIQQYLFENGRMENIFSDLSYKKFSTGFTKILKASKASVTASACIQSCVEENFLWDCKQLGAYSPIVLLNTLLFFCCKYFGLTTVEQHHQLSFAHVVCHSKNPKTTVLRFDPPVSINDEESDADSVPSKKRKKNESKEEILGMMENVENPLRCPVRLYQFYLSKCPESVRRRSDVFYLLPDRSCVPSSPLWFSSTPLDDSTMEAMLVRILTVRELQGEDRRGAHQPTSADAPRRIQNDEAQ